MLSISDQKESSRKIMGTAHVYSITQNVPQAFSDLEIRNHFWSLHLGENIKLVSQNCKKENNLTRIICLQPCQRRWVSKFEVPFSKSSQSRPWVMVELRDVTVCTHRTSQMPCCHCRVTTPGNTLAGCAQKAQLELTCYSIARIKTNKITSAKACFLSLRPAGMALP